MKEWRDFAGHRIDCRQIWALLQVAPVASQSQILKGVAPSVLFGNDVLDMVG